MSQLKYVVKKEDSKLLTLKLKIPDCLKQVIYNRFL